jgi:iron(III) transport system permease protein
MATAPGSLVSRPKALPSTGWRDLGDGSGLRHKFAPKTLYAGVLAALLAVLIIPPIGFLIWTSFRTGSPGSPEATFTLGNWASLLSSENVEPIVNTLLISSVTTIISVPCGFFFAWVELQTDTPFMDRLSSFLVIPLIFSPLLTTLAWTVLLAPRGGLLNVWAASVLPIDRIMDIYSIEGMILVSALYFIPIAYMTIRSSLKAVDSSVFEAARAGGASATTAVRRILIPLMRPGISAAALIIFTMNIGLFAVVTLLGPTSRVNTLQLDVYFSMLEAPTNPPHAAAVGVLLLVVSLLCFALYRRILRRPKRFVTVTGRGLRPIRMSLGRWRWLPFAVVLLYIAVAVVLPYLALAYGAFSPYLTSEVNLSNLSTQNFRAFFSRGDMVTGLRNSAILVVVGAAVTTAIAVFVGYLVRRTGDKMSKTLESVAMFPLAVPALSFALGILWLALSFGWGRDYLYGTLLLIYLAQLATFLPLGVQIVASGVVQLGDDMEDAGRVSGANGFARTRRILLPLLRPSIASAWIILALYASVEAAVSIFLFTGGSVTTAVNVFNNALHGLPNIMYAGAMLLATFGLITIVIGNRIFRTSKYLGGS